MHFEIKLRLQFKHWVYLSLSHLQFLLRYKLSSAVFGEFLQPCVYVLTAMAQQNVFIIYE